MDVINKKRGETVINDNQDKTQKGRLFKSSGYLVIALILTVASLYLSSCTTTNSAKSEDQEENLQDRVIEQGSLEEAWGIEVLGIRLSAVGYMLDFRYKVIDPEKAAPLLNRKSKTFLIDEASGTTVQVPAPAKIGPLRQTVKNNLPTAGRTYMVIFANPGMFIESGSKVTVAIGDFRAESLIVQ
jgi:hypothetical protein